MSTNQVVFYKQVVKVQSQPVRCICCGGPASACGMH
jgi:hypothetical protein